MQLKATETINVKARFVSKSDRFLSLVFEYLSYTLPIFPPINKKILTSVLGILWIQSL